MLGCSPKEMPNSSLTIEVTIPNTSLFPNFVFVCPSNCGSGTLTEITAVNPSFTSSKIFAWKTVNRTYS